MRNNTHRLIWYPGDSIEYELYDHTVDPLESRNVAQEKPELLQKLSSSIRDYYNGFYEQD